MPFTCLALVALAPMLVSLQPPAEAELAPRDLSGVLAPLAAEHKIPAMAAAVVRGETVVGLGVTGVRKSGDSTPATIEDKWHLGSNTKAMTATLCALLVEDGVLRWDRTVGEAFADVPMHERWKAVTLEQLLTNRAGMPADLDRDGLWASLWRHTGTPTEARRALLIGVLKHPPEHEPGTKFLYSNAGFAVAGHMAETVAGTSFESLIKTKLFDRLNMTSVGFGAPGERVKRVKGEDGTEAMTVPDQPRGHRANGTAVEPGPGADNPVAIGPAGTVHCTIGDWAKFVALHLQGARGKPRLLTAETFLKLHRPAAGQGVDRYAMGWGVTKRGWAGDHENVLTHAGSNTMWFSVAWLAPDKDFAVLVVCNKGGDAAAKACDAVAAKLIGEMLK